MARLVYMDSSGRQQVYELHHSRPQTIIGRHPDCDLVAAEPSVSRRHCAVVYEGGRFRLDDLGSANGTLLNDESVSTRHLVSRDIIRCGGLILQFFEDHEAPAPARPRYGAAGPMAETSVSRLPTVDDTELAARLRRLEAFNQTQSTRLAQLQDELFSAEQRAEAERERAFAAEQQVAALVARLQLLEDADAEREVVLRAREAQIESLLQRVGQEGVASGDRTGEFARPQRVARSQPPFGGPTEPDLAAPAVAGAASAAREAALESEVAALRGALAIREAEARAAALSIGRPRADDALAEAQARIERLEMRLAQREERLRQLAGELDVARAGHMATDAERAARLVALEYERDALEARWGAAEGEIERLRALIEQGEAWLQAAGVRLQQLQTTELPAAGEAEEPADPVALRRELSRVRAELAEQRLEAREAAKARRAARAAEARQRELEEALAARPPAADAEETATLRARVTQMEQALLALESRAQEAEQALLRARDEQSAVSRPDMDDATAERLQAMSVQLGAVTRRGKLMQAQAQELRERDNRIRKLEQALADAQAARDCAEGEVLGLTVRLQVAETSRGPAPVAPEGGLAEEIARCRERIRDLTDAWFDVEELLRARASEDEATALEVFGERLQAARGAADALRDASRTHSTEDEPVA